MEEIQKEVKNTVRQEDMNDARKFVETYQKETAAVKGTYKFALVIAAVIAVTSVVYSLWKTSEESNLVYLVDDESARLAKKMDNSLTKDMEVTMHVTRFHEKFYNISPNKETIYENINAALSLADRSAAIIHNRREEQRFYSTLIDNHIVEEVFLDSIRVNTAVFPYKAYSFGKLTIIRETKKYDYAFESSCELINTSRSSSNLNGLIIQKFKEERRELIQ